MLELPVIPLDEVADCEPILSLRHSITNTNYNVRIYTKDATKIAKAKKPMEWATTTRLRELPLTGLARKVLLRLRVMPKPH